jgi:hypothetical protein
MTSVNSIRYVGGNDCVCNQQFQPADDLNRPHFLLISLTRPKTHTTHTFLPLVLMQEHHDYITFHLERSQGVRILTVFLYLNDVEEGGGTQFSRLGITVQPKRGRVVIWPSVFDHDPSMRDERTHHEALPVLKGIKYGGKFYKRVVQLICLCCPSLTCFLRLALRSWCLQPMHGSTSVLSKNHLTRAAADSKMEHFPMDWIL